MQPSMESSSLHFIPILALSKPLAEGDNHAGGIRPGGTAGQLLRTAVDGSRALGTRGPRRRHRPIGPRARALTRHLAW